MHTKYTKSAAIYDAIYTNNGKNYAREAEIVHTLIQRYKHSSGNTLLDAACGTGGHIPFLQQHYLVEGLDASEQMLALARQRNPEVPFYQARMESFDLSRQFDVIVCLFSAIAYVKTIAELQQTVHTMCNHLDKEGVILIEPWLSPDMYHIGDVGALWVDQPNLKITWIYRRTMQDGIAIQEEHYIIATDQKIEHFVELHELGLFSYEDYLQAFRANGLDMYYDPQGVTDRGLYVGFCK